MLAGGRGGAVDSGVERQIKERKVGEEEARDGAVEGHLGGGVSD